MSNSLDIKWPMTLGAPAGSLEAKLPRPEDIGTDIPDPQRYFCKKNTYSSKLCERYHK